MKQFKQSSELDRCRPGSIEYWAEQKKNETAVSDSTVSLTWSDLNEKANRVAEGLNDLGVKAGEIVAVRTGIRSEWIVIDAALAKLGARLLGIDKRLSKSELQYILSNSGAILLICDDHDPQSSLPDTSDLKLKGVVSLQSNIEGYVDFQILLCSSAKHRYSRSDVVTIIYTSGTTGSPKGVDITSGLPTDSIGLKIVREYRASVMDAAGRNAEGSINLVTMPFSHSAGPTQVRSAIAHGNQVVLMPKFDPQDVLEVIENYRITHWSAVPTMLNRLAALPDEVLKKFDVSSIQGIMVGAAPVTLEIKKWASQYFGSGILCEGYGSTETGIVTVWSEKYHKNKTGSCGKPCRHVKIEIRDENNEVLPVGAPGEIWVWTPTIIKSYLNAPPLEAELRDERGFFRTGDIGKLDEDQFLYISDRVKDMIVSGGVNIYPAEIEAVLSRHPAVMDAAVIGIPDDEFGEQVKAIIELKEGHDAKSEELIQFVREHLSSVKQPKTVGFVKELPRNATGKILKRELRSPYWEGKEKKV